MPVTGACERKDLDATAMLARGRYGKQVKVGRGTELAEIEWMRLLYGTCRQAPTRLSCAKLRPGDFLG